VATGTIGQTAHGLGLRQLGGRRRLVPAKIPSTPRLVLRQRLCCLHDEDPFVVYEAIIISGRSEGTLYSP
jgi:hypothetical protein